VNKIHSIPIAVFAGLSVCFGLLALVTAIMHATFDVPLVLLLLSGFECGAALYIWNTGAPPTSR
jgi:hypothetical protein